MTDEIERINDDDSEDRLTPQSNEIINAEIEEIDVSLEKIKKDTQEGKSKLVEYINIGNQVEKSPTQGLLAISSIAGGAAAGSVLEVAVVGAATLVGPVAGLAVGCLLVFGYRQIKSIATAEDNSKKNRIAFQDFSIYLDKLQTDIDNLEQKIIELAASPKINDEIKKLLIEPRYNSLKSLTAKYEEFQSSFYDSLKLQENQLEKKKGLPPHQ